MIENGPLAGSTVDDIRRLNLRQVLRIAHRDGPLSRAELTRATGLNRSTIWGLVADLQDRGLLDEHAAARTKRTGRPSRTVSASSDTVAVAAHPEIDATEVALVALSGAIVRRVRYPHAQIPTPAEVVNVVSAIVAGMRPSDAGLRTTGIGIAVPGLVRSSDGHVLLAPHLGWRDVPLARMLQDQVSLPVVADNDANCGVVAESLFGAGRGADVVVYLNGGPSGIGSGIVIDGRLITGAAGLAGEFGHVLVNSAGRRCHCGATGCLETEVRLARLPGVAQSDLLVADALAAAWVEDGAEKAEIDRQLDYLAVALRNVVNALNPRRIVLGGYLAALLELVGADDLKARAGESLPGALEQAVIVPGELGSDIVVVGAAELAFGPILDDPTRADRVRSAV